MKANLKPPYSCENKRKTQNREFVTLCKLPVWDGNCPLRAPSPFGGGGIQDFGLRGKNKEANKVVQQLTCHAFMAHKTSKSTTSVLKNNVQADKNIQKITCHAVMVHKTSIATSRVDC